MGDGTLLDRRRADLVEEDLAIRLGLGSGRAQKVQPSLRGVPGLASWAKFSG
jgi:hypothetical protein